MGVQDIGYIYVSYAQICAMPKTHSAGAVKLHIPLTAVNFDISKAVVKNMFLAEIACFNYILTFRCVLNKGCFFIKIKLCIAENIERSVDMIFALRKINTISVFIARFIFSLIKSCLNNFCIITCSVFTRF